MKDFVKTTKFLASFLLLVFFLSMGTRNTLIAQTQVNTQNNAIIYSSTTKTNWDYTALELVSAESNENSRYPFIAVDSKSNIHVVWQDYTDLYGSGTDGAIFYKYWDEETQTWTPTQFISNQSGQAFYPAIAVDNKDNLHVVWEDYSGYASSGFDRNQL